MGVTGLWKLIEPCGTPVPVETLEGKVLAVDISIWLHQVVKGFQDNKGSALANAHLLGLFHRLCKLLYYRVRPVFVFDGCAPQLKRETIARRQQQRTNLNSEAERIQVLLLQSLAKEKVVQQALGANASKLLLKSPSKRVDDKTEKSDDMFKLPDLLDAPGIVQDNGTDKRTEDESDWEDSSYTTNEDSSFDASNLRHSYNANLQSIDVRSEHFRKLPAEVRHEILVDIKETRKQSSWGRLHELPARSDDFSSFQMKRLLKRRAVQETIEEVQQEMGDNTLSFAELENFLIEKGIVQSTEGKPESKQISSDENTRYILVRDLKRKLIEKEKKENNKDVPVIENEQIKEKANGEINNEKEELPSTSKEKPLTNNLPRSDEYDTDLELAIAMSLEESTVYSQRDYDYDSDENLKLNRDQRKQLKNAAIGPARTYMLEYAGMNHEEVVGIMDKTQVHPEIGHFVDGNFGTETEGENEVGSIKDTNLIVCNDDKINDLTKEILKENYNDLSLHVSDDSDTDSDLEEVAEEKCYVDDRKGTEIMLNLSQPITLEDDLFADIFKAEVKDKKEEKLEFENNVSNTEKKELEVRKEEGEVFTNVGKIPGEGTANNSTLKMESTNALVILDELKKEIDNIKHIKLSNIEINAPTNLIEVSDEEVVETLKPITQTTHVIEILDSDDLNSNNKSPQLKTPSKRKVISEYFDTDYVIKRTPDKCKMSEEDVPKVKSPFFVNKRTPKSNRKRTADTDGKTTPSPKKQISKASKSLFTDSTEKESDVLSEPSTKTASASKDLMKDAANVLREEKSAAELQALALDLAKERHDLETERNRQDRMGMNISQRMNSECQELLQLFGIPYIVAPMEAEAQCAFLDVVQLTNGTITDDSDIWLFGGHTVYKNFFAQNKHVLEFRADEIEKSFSCDRRKLIQLACLVGSDYTTGVHGIGTVTALEILAAFSSMKDLNSDEVKTSSTSVLSTLARFRDWWMVNKNSTTPPGSSARLSLRKKLKNIELHDGFPSPAVVEAYLAPKVDESKDTFSWGSPDVNAIHEFTRKIFGWTQSKTDDILAPVIKKINEKKTQATIRNYFTVKSAISVRQLKVSKRVQSAINKMNFEETEESPDQVARQIKRNTKRVKRKPPTTNTKTDANVSETVDVSKANDDLSLTASTSKNPPTKVQRPVRIPNTKELIPQREHNRQQLLKNNENAAAVLKNSKAMAGKKKRIA